MMTRRGLFALLPFGFKRREDPNTVWLGWPVTTEISSIDPGGCMPGPCTQMPIHPDYEIGLDPSGVVVWRRTPKGDPR